MWCSSNLLDKIRAATDAPVPVTFTHKSHVTGIAEFPEQAVDTVASKVAPLAQVDDDKPVAASGANDGIAHASLVPMMIRAISMAG